MLSAGAMQAQSPSTPTKPIDINTASRMELADAGWGQYADAIIAARPYKSMNDLVERNVVPATAYEKGSNRFVIGDGTTPLTDPGQSPTLNPPAATPPTVTPPSATPGTNSPSVTPGLTPPTGTPPTTGTIPPAVPQPGATPPSVQPGATSPTPGSPAPAATTPGAATSPAK